MPWRSTLSVSLTRTSEDSTLGKHKLGSHLHGSTFSRDGTFIYLLPTIQARPERATCLILNVVFSGEKILLFSASNVGFSKPRLKHGTSRDRTSLKTSDNSQENPSKGAKEAAEGILTSTAGRFQWTWAHVMTFRERTSLNPSASDQVQRRKSFSFQYVHALFHHELLCTTNTVEAVIRVEEAEEHCQVYQVRTSKYCMLFVK